jgi:hypothetical protein
MEPFGIVYIAAALQPNARRFTGYWDRGNPPEILEHGPGWDDVEEAIAWARERAPRVLVRLGDDDAAIYSAGEIRLTRLADGTSDAYPQWPPHL